MLMAEHALGGEQRGVLGQALAVHDQVLPVHVDLDVVETLGAELVDHVQRHADVPHEDLHRGLGVLVLEEEQDPVVPTPLGSLSDPFHQPRPGLRVRRLERVVVALDPRPDDEVGAELAGEVDRLERSPNGLVTRRRVRRDEPALAEPRVEMEPRRQAVHVVPVECASDLVDVPRVQLLRVVELVAVDQVSEPLDRPSHSLGGRLAGPLRLVAARDEAGDHRAERPDS